MAKDEINKPKLFLAVVSGLLLSGAFPKAGVAWLAFVALIPLFLGLKNLSGRNSFWLGSVAGGVHFLTLLYGLIYAMHIYGGLPFYFCIPALFLLGAILAAYVAVFSWSLSVLCKSPAAFFWLAPPLWVTFEYLRSFLFTGFPWELLGYSQVRWLKLVQAADLAGVYGISFLVVLANGALFMILLFLLKSDWQGERVSLKRLNMTLAVLVGLFLLVLVYGKVRLDTIDKTIKAAPHKRVSVIQGNIDQALKWDLAFQVSTTHKYIALSQAAKAERPDLVVWPETATPFYFSQDIRLSRLVTKGIIQTGTDFLIGSPSFKRSREGDQYYNSAFLVNRKGKVIGKYDKVHLVPYGEYVPFKRWIPFLGKMVEQVGDFMPGKKGATVAWGSHKLGVQICYEVIFPSLSRSMVRNGADLLVNITNDAWYGRSGIPYQHFDMTVFRAVENRRALVRAANTGFSGFVDPAGRIVAQSGLFEDAQLTRPVPMLTIKTLYTRIGDLFALLCVALCLFFGSSRLYKRVLDRERNLDFVRKMH